MMRHHMQRLHAYDAQQAEHVVQPRKHSRVARITSYDKKNYAVKVRFMPYDDGDETNYESGWIPLKANAIGNGFGIQIGPNLNDLVEVDFQEGDRMTARISERNFSEKQKPMENVEAGEYHIVHKNGQVVRFLKDGAVEIGGAGTVQTKKQDENTQSQPQGQPGNQGGLGGTGSAGPQNEQQPDAKQMIRLDKNGNVEVTSGTNQGTVTITSPKGTISKVAKNRIEMKLDDGTGVFVHDGKVFLGTDNATVPVKLANDQPATKVFAV